VTDTTVQTLLVLGGTSDIGRAAALAFAAEGWHIQYAGRSLDALQRDADDIAARTTVPVTIHAFDVLDTAAFPAFIAGLPVLPDAVLCVIGLLGDQIAAQGDPLQAGLVMRSNFEGPAQILGIFANHFEKRGSGTIIGVSSVAGDRGRASNYIYGASKAGFSTFLSGLRNRMAKCNVHVITIKPGFVRTRMTAGMKLPNALTAAPAELGKAIWLAHAKKKDVVYTRPIWRLVMTIICSIPEAVFKRLSL